MLRVAAELLEFAGSSIPLAYSYKLNLCKLLGVTPVIGLPCRNVADRASVDASVCEPVRSVEAISYEYDLLAALQPQTRESVGFPNDVLPDRYAPCGPPGGAGRLGPLTLDTSMVASQPAQIS